MTFENIKIIDPYVEKGWTPELKLTLASPEEVGALEAKLNVTFPAGYKEFVTILGKGEYCNRNSNIRVNMPSAILSEYKEHQQFLDEYWFWEDGEEMLSKEKAIECIRICDTAAGDVVIFHPSNPNELFALPHEDDMSYKIGSNLYEAFDWLSKYSDVEFGDASDQLYFMPDNPFQHTYGILYPKDV